jgi:hypothetical protein
MKKSNCGKYGVCTDGYGKGCDFFIAYHGDLYPNGICVYSDMGYCRNGRARLGNIHDVLNTGKVTGNEDHK